MVHSTKGHLSDNDILVVAWNAYRSAAAAYDLLQLLPLDDDSAAHLLALSKELSTDTNTLYVDLASTRPSTVGY